MNEHDGAMPLLLQPAAPICQTARDMGLIAITAGAGDVIRLVPPLTVRCI